MGLCVRLRIDGFRSVGGRRETVSGRQHVARGDECREPDGMDSTTTTANVLRTTISTRNAARMPNRIGNAMARSAARRRAPRKPSEARQGSTSSGQTTDATIVVATRPHPAKRREGPADHAAVLDARVPG